jgi:hypothetical protein
MINRIDLQEFLVIFEATLGFFRLTIDGVKRYFVYIAKGLELRDIKYLKKFFNTDSPITMNPTQSTESELPTSLPELLKGVNSGRPVNLRGANPGVAPHCANILLTLHFIYVPS